MDPMGNFSVLSTLKLIKALFLIHEEAVFHINFKYHLHYFQKLLMSAVSSLGKLWIPAAEKPIFHVTTYPTAGTLII